MKTPTIYIFLSAALPGRGGRGGSTPAFLKAQGLENEKVSVGQGARFCSPLSLLIL